MIDKHLPSDEDLLKIDYFCDYLGYSREELVYRTDVHDHLFVMSKRMFVRFLNKLGFNSRRITELFDVPVGYSQKCCQRTSEELFIESVNGQKDGHKFIESKIDFFV